MLNLLSDMSCSGWKSARWVGGWGGKDIRLISCAAQPGNLARRHWQIKMLRREIVFVKIGTQLAKYHIGHCPMDKIKGEGWMYLSHMGPNKVWAVFSKSANFLLNVSFEQEGAGCSPRLITCRPNSCCHKITPKVAATQNRAHQRSLFERYAETQTSQTTHRTQTNKPPSSAFISICWRHDPPCPQQWHEFMAQTFLHFINNSLYQHTLT